MSFDKFDLQVPGASPKITLEAGRAAIFVGANGSGKTRLGVFVEQILIIRGIIRIAAHRILTVTDEVSLSGYQKAVDALYVGANNNADRQNRAAYKYSNKPATAPLNDYGLMIQAIFAEEASIAVKHLNDSHKGGDVSAPTTVIMSLKRLWSKLLPHRELIFEDLTVKARPVGPEGSVLVTTYPASEMSDGERVILYLMGQCLLAPKDCAILIDEPELHIHKALMVRLWDIIEAERPDCAFIYITHDLDFVASRAAADKFAIRSFTFPSSWQIEEMKSISGLPEYVYTEIVGSRQPILFVEGERGSLDLLTYRQAYPHFLIQPVGSCDAVIHAVSTFNKNSHIHRIVARGCIDADARQNDEVARLKGMNIYVLPVAEVENLYLLPEVFKALGHSLQFDDKEVNERLIEMTDKIVQETKNTEEHIVVRYAARIIDADLKKLAPKAQTTADFKSQLAVSLAQLDPDSVVDEFRKKLHGFILKKDLHGLLSIVDNKGLLAVGARVLGISSKAELTKFASRVMNGKDPGCLLDRFRAELPVIEGPAIQQIGQSLPSDDADQAVPG